MIDIDLEPYSEKEVPSIMKRIVADENFPVLIPYVFPDRKVEDVAQVLLSCKTTRDFQSRFMANMIRSFVKRTATSMTFSGMENIKQDKSFLYIGNHRDIVLDSGILQVLLLDMGLETSEMSIGKNLMVNQLICDLGKANKMIPVERNGNVRDLLKSSSTLSKYIRRSITEKDTSVWIAQRNGRAKDGFDKTEAALLKMLNMSGQNSIEDNFKDLNIIPIAISYEIEPCDILKVQEIYETRKGGYVKKPGEDAKSMAIGLMQPKGRIHMSIGECINKRIDTISGNNANENYASLARIIDQEVYKNYKCWPGNFIAYDMINTPEYQDEYTSEDKKRFMSYYEDSLSKLKGEKDKLTEIFLNLYAFPVKNKAASDIT